MKDVVILFELNETLLDIKYAVFQRAIKEIKNLEVLISKLKFSFKIPEEVFAKRVAGNS